MKYGYFFKRTICCQRILLLTGFLIIRSEIVYGFYQKFTIDIKLTNPEFKQKYSETNRLFFHFKLDGAAIDEQTPTIRVSQAETAKVTALVPFDEMSPYGDSWEAVFQHMAQKILWINSSYQLTVFSDKIFQDQKLYGLFEKQVNNTDIFLAASIQKSTIPKLQRCLAGIKTIAVFNSSNELFAISKFGNYNPSSLVPRLIAPALFPKDAKLYEDVTRLFNRSTPDDLQYLILLLINQYVMPVPLVSGGNAGGPALVKCILKNCKDEVVDCFSNPSCRKAVACLSQCAPHDQTCAYRCLVSYESEELENFSLCILQKNNCLGNTALPIRMEPDTAPLQAFRGQPLTKESAEDILIGWLDKMAWSWKVVCGQNPAYDFFPCQHQIFYRSKANGNLWYDPVFKVLTLDGKEVWRRRHYKVRHGPKIGTFYFSVLDNGVTSNEFWRIIDCKDDMSWAILVYQGAAPAAGSNYGGSLLVTPDGNWPKSDQMKRITESFERAGIKMWELYNVNNSFDCSDAPFGVPDEYVPFNSFLKKKT